MKAKLLALTLIIINIVLLLVSTACNTVANAGTASSIPFESCDNQESYSVPIIMYHSTHKKKPGKYNIPPSLLEQDLKYLLDKGYTTITVSDLIGFQEDNIPLPKKPVMLTFDDGYTNNYLYAYPLFVKYNMKCVISVVGKYTDDNYIDGKIFPTNSHITYEQIKEMSESGHVEIQNHTYNLHKSSGERSSVMINRHEKYDDYEKILSEDLTKLQTKLKENAGISPTAVAYPFGKFSPETITVLKKLGFKAGFTCFAGINNITKTSDLFRLKRYNRPYGCYSKAFFTKIGVANET